jgi:hypothetical protein
MKKLLLLIALFITGFVAGCNAQTLRDSAMIASPYDGILDGKLSIGYIALHDVGWPCDCSKCNKVDTARSILLVTTRIPGFAHAVVGYCVSRNGACISHLDCRKRVLKLPVKVWGCEGRYPKENAGISQ